MPTYTYFKPESCQNSTSSESHFESSSKKPTSLPVSPSKLNLKVIQPMTNIPCFSKYSMSSLLDFLITLLLGKGSARNEDTNRNCWIRSLSFFLRHDQKIELLATAHFPKKQIGYRDLTLYPNAELTGR